MELVTKKRAYWGTLLIPLNMRFTVPDEIGVGLTARGMAEEIKQDILEMEKAEKKKGKK